MSSISFLLLLVLGISMLATGFMLANSLNKNFQQGQSVRYDLAEKVDQLRYGQILNLFGVNKNLYLHKVPMNKIDAEMRTCRSCEWTNECDKALQHSDYVNDEVLRFCPNASSILAQKTIC